jgi:polyhydroxybutyrate depolymerase
MRKTLTLAATLLASPAWACGPSTDCEIADRTYRIAMPDGHDGTSRVGAIVFSHGYRGSAAGLMRNRNLRRAVSDMGLAFIALKSKDDDWVLPNAPRHMDSDGEVEFSYVDAVLDHAEANFAIDRDKLMASGFSAGGMMTWNLACHRSASFAGFAPISGTFWLKAPETCKAPVTSIIHIHGNDDPTVPLTGRPIGPTHQGDVSEALAMYDIFGDFTPTETSFTDRLSCSNSANKDGEILSFCIFEGGHSFRSEYLKFAWETLEKAGRL